MSALKKKSDGFTLIELIVGITLMGLFIGAVSNLINTNATLSQRARDVSAVNSFAENKVEELRSAGYLSLSNGTTSISSEMPSELNSPRSASLIISSASTSIKKIDLNLTYNEQGKSRDYSYTTYIGELGVGQY